MEAVEGDDGRHRGTPSPNAADGVISVWAATLLLTLRDRRKDNRSMAQATLTRILEDIRTLELDELPSVERAVQERLETAAYSPEEWRAMQALVKSSLLKEIKPRRRDKEVEFAPVQIQGKPLSETIVEERR